VVLLAAPECGELACCSCLPVANHSDMTEYVQFAFTLAGVACGGALCVYMVCTAWHLLTTVYCAAPGVHYAP
jgi:hypothetical protein